MMQYANGIKEWRVNGRLHREGDPALECPDVTKEWWLNGQLHRANGPAKEYADGRKIWYLNGERHRADGPAVEISEEIFEYWYRGVKISEEEYFSEEFQVKMVMEE